MALATGTRLGPYEILSALGAGGMGEVYKALDTRLDRTVAIKILPETLAGDPQFRERFDREARAISQLDHPNICTLHDVGEQDGTAFLVMQFLEGDTLEGRLKKGALPLDQALTAAIQIASALDKAHRAGIVHRDLKPGNIMLTKSGAKLLDFGLAKSSSPVVAASLSLLPTTPPNLTAQGTILGTFQYMAPEQLEGQEADARTDIFAFGAVLYEMLTGKKAFEGKSQASLIGAIMHAEPAPVASLQPLAPVALGRLIKKCLAKDADARWQSCRDLGDELSWVTSQKSDTPSVQKLSWRERTVWASALLCVVLGAALWVQRSESAISLGLGQPEMRLEIPTPLGASLNHFAISPDGRSVVFRAPSGRQDVLWLRTLDSDTARPLPGTEGGAYPFWAPDSRLIAFFANGQLRRLDLASGIIQTLAAAPGGRGGTWSRDGVILFAPSTSSPIFRVGAEAGAAAPVTHIDAPEETDHRFPSFLPDGRHFLYYVYGALKSRGVYVASLDGTQAHRLIDVDSMGLFSPPDFVLFARQGALLAQRIDLRKLATVGAPVPVARHVADNPDVFGAIAFSASVAGPIAFRSVPEMRQLVWLNRAGDRVGTIGEPDASQLGGISLSPDGKTIALDRTVDGNTDVWILDTSRGVSRRLTTGAARDKHPIWSPDSTRLVFDSDPQGTADLYQREVSGLGSETLLTSSTNIKNPGDWSPDGRYLVYTELNPTTQRDVLILPLFGDKKPWAFAQSPIVEAQPRFSPGGQWIAYQANDSGRGEIYVQSFPQPAAKIQVSSNGGSIPLWRRDGRELFFVTPDNHLSAVSIQSTGSSFEPSAPSVLFSIRPGSEYAVAADGQKFLVNVVIAEAAPITVIVNRRISPQ